MAGDSNSFPSLTAVIITLLLVVAHSPGFLSQIVFNETDTDAFEISLSGIKVFQHNATHPMMFIGSGQTTIKDFIGNAKVFDYVTSRIPLRSVFQYTRSIIDIELYEDTDTFVRFQIKEDEHHAMVLQVIEMSPPEMDRLWLRLVAEPDEKVYGGGEQFSNFNLRGHAYPIVVQEQGIGRSEKDVDAALANRRDGGGGGYHTTYFPQPTYLSTRGYYMHHAAQGSTVSILDFSQDLFHEVHFITKDAASVGGVRIQNGSDVAALVSHLTGYLGRQPPLPDWIFSGATIQTLGGTEAMLGRLRQAKDHLLPVAAVWIKDWGGAEETHLYGPRGYWDWVYDRQRYPGLPEVIADLTSKGIRVLGSINPFLRTDGQLFSEADTMGYFVKNATNQTYIKGFYGDSFYCGIVDLTNPAAWEWYKNDVIKKNLIELGFSGWMADFGEDLPVDGAFFHSGQSGEELHNTWPVMWARLNREAVEEAGKLGEIVFWMKSGFSGVGNYTTLLWAGDQKVDWSVDDGLPSVITAALSSGLSGVALTHFEIGGYDSNASSVPPLLRSEELLMRSAEMAVFTPVFRTQAGLANDANVQYFSTRGTLRKFGRLVRMFAGLQNYTRHVVLTASVTGLPAQRPLFLNYPSDLPSYDVQYQYLYGDDLLVAPVYQPGVVSRDVYLPRDPEATWVFLWDESIVSAGGESVTVPAPVGRPPVFYRNVTEFVHVFHHLTRDPLVDIPPYVPGSIGLGPGSGSGSGEGDGPPVCRSAAMAKFDRPALMVMLALLLGIALRAL